MSFIQLKSGFRDCRAERVFFRGLGTVHKAKGPRIMKYFLACAFLLVATACTTDDDEAQRSITGNKYVNPTIGATLQFPSSWQLKMDYKFGEMTLDLAAFAPSISGFSANVLIAFDSHQGTDNMYEVLKMIKARLSARYPDMRDYGDTVYQVDGKDVGEMVYTTAVGGRDYRAKSVYFVNRNKEVSITYTDMVDRYVTNADFTAIQSSMSIE